jgi:hypothetical protein
MKYQNKKHLNLIVASSFWQNKIGSCTRSEWHIHEDQNKAGGLNVLSPMCENIPGAAHGFQTQNST